MFKLKKGGVDNNNEKTIMTLFDQIAEPVSHIINLVFKIFFGQML